MNYYTCNKDRGNYHDDGMPGETCPECNGPGVFMGSLGRLDWFRCRNCGMEFSQEDADAATRREMAHDVKGDDDE